MMPRTPRSTRTDTLFPDPTLCRSLFYLASTTLAVAMLFLLVELVKRTGVQAQAQTPDVDAAPDEEDNLDDAQLPLIGVAFPISVAMLGLAFITCALLVDRKSTRLNSSH